MIKISALPAAGTLSGSELVPVVKSGVTSQTTSQAVANLGATAANLAGVINAATSKVTPVDADELPLADSAAAYGLKKLLWSNLKATLKTYFDTLYQPLATILTQLSALTTARGDILYKGNAGWTNLAAGTSGYVLTSAGPGADPTYTTKSTLVLATPKASTSGTAVDFTSLPSGVKRIVMMGNGVSTNGTNTFLVQIGDSGGIETSGYDSSTDFPTNYGGTSTAGFRISYSNAAASTYYFKVTLDLLDSSTNTWVATGQLQAAGSSGSQQYSFGIKATSAELDRIRLTTTGGTDTFDAGTVNIQYQT